MDETAQTLLPPVEPVAESNPAEGNPPSIPPRVTPPPHQLGIPKLLLVCIGIFLILIGGWFVIVRFYSTRLQKSEALTPNVTRIKTAGKIIIGTEATFPPMEFINDKGEYSGYDIELGERIAEKMGVKAEFKNIVFNNFITEVTSKNVDIVISAVSITDERKKEVDFSDTYLNAGQVIITRKADASIHTTKDLKGKKIAVQKGTTNEEQAKSFTTPELVLSYEDYEQATQALLGETADAIFSDLTGAKGIIDKFPTLKVASDPFTDEEYGVVFRKGETDLLTEVNTILNGLRQQGILTFLTQKWLE